MKRELSRMTCILLTLVLCVSLFTYAEATEITPRYEYTSRVDASISITPITGVATCKGIVMAYDQTHTVKVFCYLQYYFNDQWVTLQHWTTSAEEYASVTGYHAIARGHLYRVRCVGYIYDSSGRYIETCSATNQCNY